MNIKQAKDQIKIAMRAYFTKDEFGAAHLKTTIGTGAVVCLASDLIPIDRKNWYVPAWCI